MKLTKQNIELFAEYNAMNLEGKLHKLVDIILLGEDDIKTRRCKQCRRKRDIKFYEMYDINQYFYYESRCIECNSCDYESSELESEDYYKN